MTSEGPSNPEDPSAPGKTSRRRHRTVLSSASRPSRFVCIGLGVLAAGLIFAFPFPLFSTLDWKLYDLRMRWRNALIPQAISDSILVVGIDERDHYNYDEEFFSRWAYAKFLETLQPYRPEAVVFDILFPSRRSFDDLFAHHLHNIPSFLSVDFQPTAFERRPDFPPPEDLRSLEAAIAKVPDASAAWGIIEQLRDYEDQLDNAVERLRTAAHEEASAEQRAELWQRLAWVRFLINQALQAHYQDRFSIPFDHTMKGDPFDAEDVSLPSAMLLHACAGAGFINLKKGTEDIVRRVPLVYAYRNRLYPSLDLLVALHYYGARFADCRIVFGRAIEFTPRRNATSPKRIPIDNHGQYLINFRQGEEYLRQAHMRTLSFYSHPQYAEQREQAGLHHILPGAILLVGEMAAGTTDVQPIPLQPLYPLIGVHANVLDNILKDDYIRPAPRWLEPLLVLAVGILLGFVYSRRESREATRIALGMFILYGVGQFTLFLYAGNYDLPLARVLATIVLAYVLLILYIVGVTERDRRLVKDIFLKSVSPRIGEEILRNFNDPSLWASRRRISVLFVDIRGFTSMSERLSPDRLVERLDAYYDTVSEIVFRHDGQVNKFIGDAVMALFGALPGEDARHAERAVRAALDILRGIHELNERTAAREGVDTPLRVGVGVNTGEVVVGTVGRRKIRIEYTALGDVVNTAERLQGQAGSGKIYVGAETVEEIRRQNPGALETGLRFSRIEGLVLKGKTQSVEVYALHTGEPLPELPNPKDSTAP